MKQTPLKRLGKKGKAWESERRRLKKEFEAIGITRCEAGYAGCFRDNWLGFAHLKKRRNLMPGELGIVVLLCSQCHDALERLPEAEMGEKLQAIIDRREV